MRKAVPHSCPYCDASLRPVAMECPVCGVEIRGRFRQTLFQMLTPEEQELLEKYLLAGFSIKALEQETGMGYVAIRTRLNRLIERYQRLRQGENEKRKILDKVASGEITAAQAAELITRIQTSR
jgi:hypothetical protein